MLKKNLSEDNLSIDKILIGGESRDFNTLIKDEALFDEFCNLRERNLLEDFEIEINYMTYSQVKKKRYDLYKKKLMF